MAHQIKKVICKGFYSNNTELDDEAVNHLQDFINNKMRSFRKRSPYEIISNIEILHTDRRNFYIICFSIE